MGSLPEWSIIRRSKFRTVRHNRHVREAVFVQRLPDCGNTPVHHIGRCNDVCARFRKGNAHFCQKRQCFVIQYLPFLHKPAMPVRSIFAEAYVCNYQQVGIIPLDLAYRPLGNAVRRICL